MGDGRNCPACRSDDLQAPVPPPVRRAVCGHCGRCWEVGGRGAEVDTLTCPGCSRRGTCEACPTPLAESLTRRHLLGDGEEVEIRPLRYGDRFELATAFIGPVVGVPPLALLSTRTTSWTPESAPPAPDRRDSVIAR
jgi:hypothetical protein